MSNIFVSAIKNWLDVTFPSNHNWLVVPETKIYRWKEDKDVWKQHKGTGSQVVEVYLKVNKNRTEYVCDISEVTPHHVAFAKVQTGLENIKKQLEKEYAATTN
jgi:hypothetical protein